MGVVGLVADFSNRVFQAAEVAPDWCQAALRVAMIVVRLLLNAFLRKIIAINSNRSRWVTIEGPSNELRRVSCAWNGPQLG